MKFQFSHVSRWNENTLDHLSANYILPTASTHIIDSGYFCIDVDMYALPISNLCILDKRKIYKQTDAQSIDVTIVHHFIWREANKRTMHN